MGKGGRLEAQRAVLRVVAEALGGDLDAYQIAGYLARHQRATGGSINTLTQLRALERPEGVVGIGAGRAARIREWQRTQSDPR